mmetsp:Transcript_93083/g.164592  ORF Transcript_93083/g.164592 Transcript_93083/m.164592 type:complete len:385 (+) Transcript_93083:42-1196(+)
MEPPGGEPSDETVVAFGKHRGRTFKDVVTAVPDYCKWVLKTSQTSVGQCAAFDLFTRYLQQRPELKQSSSFTANSQQAPLPKPHWPKMTMAAPLMKPPVPGFGVHPYWPHGAFPAPAMPMSPGTSKFLPAEPAACAGDPESKRQKTKHVRIVRTLSSSSYLKLYSATPQKPTAKNCLLAVGTSPDLEDVASGISALPVDDPSALDAYIVKLWAKFKGKDKAKGGVDFYKLLNDAVIDDDEERLKMMMPIARVLNNILVNYFPQRDTVTWRGSQMTQEQFAEISVGANYRVAMFLASSLDFGVAERFVRFEPGRVIVKLCIPRECHNIGYLGIEMFDEQELEYLMPPYTAVGIVSKSRHREYFLLTVRVHKDNKRAPLDLSSILL